jgi:hypothetical protein
LVGEATLSVPDVANFLANETAKGALKKGFAKALKVSETKITSFVVSAASASRRLLHPQDMDEDVKSPARQLAAGDLKVAYTVDLIGVSDATTVTAKAKALTPGELTQAVKVELKAIAYPGADSITAKTFTATNPEKVSETSGAKVKSMPLMMVMLCLIWLRMD